MALDEEEVSIDEGESKFDRPCMLTTHTGTSCALHGVLHEYVYIVHLCWIENTRVYSWLHLHVYSREECLFSKA